MDQIECLCGPQLIIIGFVSVFLCKLYLDGSAIQHINFCHNLVNFYLVFLRHTLPVFCTIVFSISFLSIYIYTPTSYISWFLRRPAIFSALTHTHWQYSIWEVGLCWALNYYLSITLTVNVSGMLGHLYIDSGAGCSVDQTMKSSLSNNMCWALP